MATTSEASVLQKVGNVMRFSWITVGLLAMLGFSACGVGVDDPVGQQAATASSGQALLIGPDGKPVQDPSGEPVPAGQGPVDPTIAALPSDPVPWHNPNPAAAANATAVDPMAAPVVSGSMPVK